MRPFAVGLFLVIAGCVVVALVFVHLRETRSWQEKSVRAQAETLGCNMTHGVGNIECISVAQLRKGEHGTWIVRYGNAQQRHICYELWPNLLPPRRHACSSQ